MQALVLNGCLPGDDEAERAFKAVLKECREKKWHTKYFLLREMNIYSCRGCFSCLKKGDWLCVVEDDSRIINKLVMQSDLVIFFSPVIFGGFSSLLKRSLDRMLPLAMGLASPDNSFSRSHFPALAAIGLLSGDDPESERIFSEMIRINAQEYGALKWQSGFIKKGMKSSEMCKEIKNILGKVD